METWKRAPIAKFNVALEMAFIHMSARRLAIVIGVIASSWFCPLPAQGQLVVTEKQARDQSSKFSDLLRSLHASMTWIGSSGTSDQQIFFTEAHYTHYFWEDRIAIFAGADFRYRSILLNRQLSAAGLQENQRRAPLFSSCQATNSSNPSACNQFAPLAERQGTKRARSQFGLDSLGVRIDPLNAVQIEFGQRGFNFGQASIYSPVRATLPYEQQLRSPQFSIDNPEISQIRTVIKVFPARGVELMGAYMPRLRYDPYQDELLRNAANTRPECDNLLSWSFTAPSNVGHVDCQAKSRHSSKPLQNLQHWLVRLQASGKQFVAAFTFYQGFNTRQSPTFSSYFQHFTAAAEPSQSTWYIAKNYSEAVSWPKKNSYALELAWQPNRQWRYSLEVVVERTQARHSSTEENYILGGASQAIPLPSTSTQCPLGSTLHPSRNQCYRPRLDTEHQRLQALQLWLRNQDNGGHSGRSFFALTDVALSVGFDFAPSNGKWQFEGQLLYTGQFWDQTSLIRQLDNVDKHRFSLPVWPILRISNHHHLLDRAASWGILGGWLGDGYGGTLFYHWEVHQFATLQLTVEAIAQEINRRIQAGTPDATYYKFRPILPGGSLGIQMRF